MITFVSWVGAFAKDAKYIVLPVSKTQLIDSGSAYFYFFTDDICHA